MTDMFSSLLYSMFAVEHIKERGFTVAISQTSPLQTFVSVIAVFDISSLIPHPWYLIPYTSFLIIHPWECFSSRWWLCHHLTLSLLMQDYTTRLQRGFAIISASDILCVNTVWLIIATDYISVDSAVLLLFSFPSQDRWGFQREPSGHSLSSPPFWYVF